MTWFKVDDGFYDRPKVVAVNMAGRGLWVSAGTYCARHLTDGHITLRQARKLGGTKAQIDALINAGMWVVCSFHDDCVAFHDWNDYQPLRNDVEDKRESARNRMAKVRGRKASASEDADLFARTGDDDAENGSPYPDPTRPVSIKDSAIQTPDEMFEDWWKLYPRKAGKGQARTAFRTAIKKTECATLFAAVKAFAKSVADEDPKFIAHGSTWLNGERWLDDGIQIVTDNSIAEWIDECESTGNVSAVMERTGLMYWLPDLPEDITDAEDIRDFHFNERVKWIRNGRNAIIEIVLKKESD